MKKIFAIQGRNFLETIAIAFPYADAVESVFDSALANGGCISDIPIPGKEYLLVEPDKKTIASRPVLPFFAPKRKVVKNDRQNLQDLSIQTTGTFENIFELALLNGVPVTDEAVPGTAYSIYGENIDNEVLGFFASRSIRQETGLIIDENADCIYAVCSYVIKGYWV